MQYDPIKQIFRDHAGESSLIAGVRSDHDDLARKIYELEFPYDEEIHRRMLTRDPSDKNKMAFETELDCHPYSCFITAQFTHVSRTLYLRFVEIFDKDEYDKVLEKASWINNGHDKYIVIYQEITINEGLIDVFNKHNKTHIYSKEEFEEYIS